MIDFKTIIILEGQTLVDIAIQEYGSYDGVFVLVLDNPNVLNHIHDAPAIGTKLNIRKGIPVLSALSADLHNYFDNKELHVTSGIDPYTGLPAEYVVDGYMNDLYIEEGNTGAVAQDVNLVSNLMTNEDENILNPILYDATN